VEKVDNINKVIHRVLIKSGKTVYKNRNIKDFDEKSGK